MKTLNRKFKTIYKGNLYTVTIKGEELIEAYYENSNDKVFEPSLLHNLEHYVFTGLYAF